MHGYNTPWPDANSKMYQSGLLSGIVTQLLLTKKGAQSIRAGREFGGKIGEFLISGIKRNTLIRINMGNGLTIIGAE